MLNNVIKKKTKQIKNVTIKQQKIQIKIKI